MINVSTYFLPKRKKRAIFVIFFNFAIASQSNSFYYLSFKFQKSSLILVIHFII
jgi:hypothetical protein